MSKIRSFTKAASYAFATQKNNMKD